MKQRISILILITASLVLLAAITPSFLHNKKHEISNNQLIGSHIYGLIAGNIERRAVRDTDTAAYCVSCAGAGR